LKILTKLIVIQIIGVIILVDSSAYDVYGGGRSNGVLNGSALSNFTEHIPEIDNTSSQKTHSDLIRSCSTFREIISAEVANSCDYSMLYYKGQCELYSDLLRENRTDTFLEAENDLSFCFDPRVDKYIQDYDLTNALRSPSLIPDYELSDA
jgi:hypothetical protein